jgi:hypothetical protein
MSSFADKRRVVRLISLASELETEAIRVRQAGMAEAADKLRAAARAVNGAVEAMHPANALPKGGSVLHRRKLTLKGGRPRRRWCPGGRGAAPLEHGRPAG